jgi:hypothetical protein
MSEHDCKYETEITNLLKWVDGNGKPGLREQATRIGDHLTAIDIKMGDLATNVSALVKFQTEMVTIVDIKRRTRMNAWQRASVIISAVLGFTGVIITLLFKLIT